MRFFLVMHNIIIWFKKFLKTNFSLSPSGVPPQPTVPPPLMHNYDFSIFCEKVAKNALRNFFCKTRTCPTLQVFEIPAHFSTRNVWENSEGISHSFKILQIQFIEIFLSAGYSLRMYWTNEFLTANCFLKKLFWKTVRGNKRIYWTNFWQPTIHVQKNI